MNKTKSQVIWTVIGVVLMAVLVYATTTLTTSTVTTTGAVTGATVTTTGDVTVGGDVLHAGALDFFPEGNGTVGFRMDYNTQGTYHPELSADGGTWVDVVDNLEVVGGTATTIQINTSGNANFIANRNDTEDSGSFVLATHGASKWSFTMSDAAGTAKIRDGVQFKNVVEFNSGNPPFMNVTGRFGVAPQAPPACSAATETQLYYNLTLHNYLFCNSTDWVAIS